MSKLVNGTTGEACRVEELIIADVLANAAVVKGAKTQDGDSGAAAVAALKLAPRERW